MCGFSKGGLPREEGSAAGWRAASQPKTAGVESSRQRKLPGLKLGTLEKERAWNGGRGNLKCIEEWEPSKVPKPGNDAARFNTEKLTQVA